MHRFVCRTALLALLISPTGGCASDEDTGEAPVIESWQVEADAVRLGEASVLMGTLSFSDPDGDLDVAEIELVDPEGTRAMTTAEIAGVDDLTEGTVGVQVSVLAQRTGTFEVRVVLLDIHGNTSDPATASFELR